MAITNGGECSSFRCTDGTGSCGNPLCQMNHRKSLSIIRARIHEPVEEIMSIPTRTFIALLLLLNIFALPALSQTDGIFGSDDRPADKYRSVNDCTVRSIVKAPGSGLTIWS